MKSAILSGAGSSVPAGFPPTRPHPHDPDAKIAKMKDGRTHLAHTAEHAVDLRTDAIVGVTVQDASAGDTTTLAETLITAAEQVEAVGARGIVEVVADKGYHSNETMVGFAVSRVPSYVSEPVRGRRRWKGKTAARDAVYAKRTLSVCTTQMSFSSKCGGYPLRLAATARASRWSLLDRDRNGTLAMSDQTADRPCDPCRQHRARLTEFREISGREPGRHPF